MIRIRSIPTARGAGVVAALLALGAVAGYLASAVRGGAPADASPTPMADRLACDDGPAPATAPDLARLCEAEARRLVRRLDGAMSVTVEPPFVIAAGADLDHWSQRVLLPAAEAMWGRYFDTRPAEPIIILAAPDEATYRRLALRMFGDDGVSRFGYYRPRQRTLVLNGASGGGTLCHELTHALIAVDWPEAPLWLNEGLASLHEECRIEDGRILGRENWRLPGLQQAIQAGRLRPLAELMTADDFYGADRPANYAQARYFLMYLQQRGLLEQFYRTCRAELCEGASPVEVAERICGQSIAEIDGEARAFALELQWAPRR